MKLEQRYTTISKKAKNLEAEKDKIELSEDAYAVCEFLEHLTVRLNRL